MTRVKSPSIIWKFTISTLLLHKCPGYVIQTWSECNFECHSKIINTCYSESLASLCFNNVGFNIAFWAIQVTTAQKGFGPTSPTRKWKETILLTVGKYCLCIAPSFLSNLKQIFSKITIAIIFEGVQLKTELGKGSFPQSSVLETVWKFMTHY